MADRAMCRYHSRDRNVGAKQPFLELVEELGRERLLPFAAEQSREEAAARLREALLEAHAARARARGTRPRQPRTRARTMRCCVRTTRPQARRPRADRSA